MTFWSIYFFKMDPSLAVEYEMQKVNNRRIEPMRTDDRTGPRW